MSKRVVGLKSHCNNCNGTKNFVVLHRHDTKWDEDVNEGRNWIWGADSYLLLQCAGCDHVQFRHESTFSEDDPSEGPRVKLYPPPLARRQPSWIDDIIWAFGSDAHVAIGELLKEIYAALQNDSLRSAAMAVRALLETIMIDKVGDQGGIEKNVAAFLAAGYVPKISENLFRGTLIEGGNAAMHRGWKPSPTELGTMMDLVEWLIAAIYFHPAPAAAVQAKIPPRKKRLG